MARKPPVTGLGLLAPRYWHAWLGAGLAPPVARLPYRLQVMLGRVLGRLFQHLNPYRRTVADLNLELCFPELDRQARGQLGSRMFTALGISIQETIAGVWAPQRYFRDLGRIEGLEHLETARARGRGVILLSGHFCSPDFAGRILMRHVPACFTYHELRNPVFDRVVRKRRQKNCRRLIHRHDMRGFVRALKAGETVWYAPDQDQGSTNSVFAPMFGLPASTLTATSRLARLSGAAVLPFNIQRLPDAGGYLLEIEPALEDFPGADQLVDASRFNALIEAQIRANPEQYLWIHRRFKTRPPGEPKLYPQKPRRIRRQQRRLARQRHD